MRNDNNNNRQEQKNRKSARPQKISKGNVISWEDMTFLTDDRPETGKGMIQLMPVRPEDTQEESGKEPEEEETAFGQTEGEPSSDPVVAEKLPEELTEEETVSEKPAEGNEKSRESAEEKKELHRSSARPYGSGRTVADLEAAARTRSARPARISYVDISGHEIFEAPLNKSKKKGRSTRTLGFIAGMAFVAAVSVYAGISYYYTDHFIPGTTINGMDVSRMTAYEVEQAISGHYDDYRIEVASRGHADQSISGSSIDYHYLSDGEVLKLLQQQKPYTWAMGYFTDTAYSTQTNIVFDKELLRSQLKALDCTQEENQESPANAYVTLEGDSFTIIPETQGNEIKVKEAYRMLDDAVSQGQDSVDFDSDPDVYEQAELTSDSPLIKSMLDAYNNYAAASITYTFGDEKVVLDSDILKSWLEFDEQGQLISGESSFEQHVRDYVAKLAADHDTVGTSRPFYATSGELVYVYGYSYGWMIDQDAETARLMEEITSGTQITREPEYSMTANSHGLNDFGNTYIEVDLGSQYMYYYRDGYVIFESDFVSGDITIPGRATPEGVYTLYFKQSPAVLRGQAGEDGQPEYETQVTYWMPFNGGIGFHDATWQPWFGGDRFMGGGSHGCINLPYYAAAELYSIIDYGVPIICFY